MSVETVKLSREEVYRANAVKDGYVWSWDTYAGKYKLESQGKIVGWVKTLREVKAEIKELRFVAKGNLTKDLRKLGYSTANEWCGQPTQWYSLEFRGSYLKHFQTIEECEAYAREYEKARQSKINREIDAMWSKAV